ncbi:MAG TPA: cytochrome b [Gammaproteobacteria bacterium]|nr:cytochrome b [Gammaproteobacteria bacterium]
MQFKNTPDRFGMISKSFHWLMFVLISVQLYLIWTFETLQNTDPSRGLYMHFHKSVGVTILLVGILWIIWRMRNIHPMPLPSRGSWQHRLAGITHNLLLLGVIAMPISGLFMSLTAGRNVDWFSIYTLTPPAFIPVNEVWAGNFKLAHQLIATALIALVCLHVAGALVHHFIYKDRVLKRMLPFVK